MGRLDLDRLAHAAGADGGQQARHHGPRVALGQELVGQLQVLGPDALEVVDQGGHALPLAGGQLVAHGGGGGDLAPLDLDLGLAHQALHEAPAAGGGEGHAAAGLSGPARAPAAVHVGLRVLRLAGVDHQLHVRDVEAAGRHVRGDEHLDRAGTEGREGARALGLHQLAGEGQGAEAVRVQRLGHVPGGGAGVDEDQHALVAGQEEQVDQGPVAVLLAHEAGDVLDVAVGVAEARALDVQGLALVALRQLADGGREGGGDQVCAALGGRLLEDPLELLAEAHVEHLVGLVEDDRPEGSAVEGAALDVVEQAAGGADHDPRSAPQLPPLAGHAGAAGADRHVHAPDSRVEPAELALDLAGQLAGGGDDEHARTGGPLSRRRDQLLRHGEAQGDGLARPGLGRDQEVAPLRVALEHGALDRRELLEALEAHGLPQGVGDARLEGLAGGVGAVGGGDHASLGGKKGRTR